MSLRNMQTSGKKSLGDFAVKHPTTRSWTRFRLPGSAPEDVETEASDGRNAPVIPSQRPFKGTFLDAGASFEGILKLTGDFRIDHEFIGELTTDGTVVVGPSGSVEGNIQARQIEIEGAVVGDITARRMCILRANGRLHGNIETACLEIERRAFFQGSTTMTRPLAERARSTSETTTDVPGYAAGDVLSPPGN